MKILPLESIMRTFLLALPLLTLGACFDGDDKDDTGGDDGGTECTLEARSSVQLTLVYEDGSPVSGVTVQYSADGAEPQDCDNFDGNIWVCGYEVAGAITLLISGEHIVDKTVEVEVESDECHVITEQLTEVVELADDGHDTGEDTPDDPPEEPVEEPEPEVGP